MTQVEPKHFNAYFRHLRDKEVEARGEDAVGNKWDMRMVGADLTPNGHPMYFISTSDHEGEGELGSKNYTMSFIPAEKRLLLQEIDRAILAKILAKLG